MEGSFFTSFYPISSYCIVLTLITRKKTIIKANAVRKSSTNIGVMDIIPTAAINANAANDNQGSRWSSAQLEKR